MNNIKHLLLKPIIKLESYSIKKQFWILFFIATWYLWVMPILSMLIYWTGLDSTAFFQSHYYKEFTFNTTCGKPFSPDLITDFCSYRIYIYIYMFNIFHIISFILFLTMLIRSSISTIKKTTYSFIFFIVYASLVFVDFFIGIIGTIAGELLGMHEEWSKHPIFGMVVIAIWVSIIPAIYCFIKLSEKAIDIFKQRA